MRTRSIIRSSMFAAGLALAFAAVPLSQAVAQDTSPAMQKSANNQTVPDKAADAWISVVTLTGTVSSENEKMRAQRVAQLVKGVKSVDASGLTVGGTPPAEK